MPTTGVLRAEGDLDGALTDFDRAIELKPTLDTIVVDLEPGETRRLRMVAGRSLGSILSLKID